MKIQWRSTSSVMYLVKIGDEIVDCATFSGMTRERLKHRGELAEIISLEVRHDNIRAVKLYEKYGFRKIGSFPGFFKINGAYIDFDLMICQLF